MNRRERLVKMVKVKSTDQKHEIGNRLLFLSTAPGVCVSEKKKKKKNPRGTLLISIMFHLIAINCVLCVWLLNPSSCPLRTLWSHSRRKQNYQIMIKKSQ